MAEFANQEGNKHYKEGKYIQAKKCFQEATKIGPNEPKYPSNLSAVLYELGQYQECITAIRKAWTRLRARNPIEGKLPTPIESDPLAIKLATRFAKANVNTVASKAASLHDMLSPDVDLDTDIEKFVKLEREGSDDTKIQEMKAAWDQWQNLRDECAQHTSAECSKITDSAAARLRATPILKSSPDPTLEFFRIGHDPVQSMMNGLNGLADDPHSLAAPQYRHQDRWTFLFGGSGDARHVFATMIHLRDMANEVGLVEPTDRLSVHMTLIDIHPATLARVIVIFALIQQILVARYKYDKSQVVELHTTLFFLYTSMLMPDYCRRIIIDTCKGLVEDIPKGTCSLLRCLYLNEKSTPAILDILQLWAAPLQKSTKLMLQRNPVQESLLHQGIGAQGPNLNNLLAESMRKNLPARRGSLTDPYTNPNVELKIFERIRILLPPKSHLSRHPALANFVKSYHVATEAQYKAVKSEVEQTWVPNPTMFDRTSQNPRNGIQDGYPHVPSNPFETLASFADFTKEFGRDEPTSSSGCSGFVASSRFFELVADAVWELQNTLAMEVIVGDVIMGLPKLLSGDLGERPKEFPRTYSRMFLSNIPDYTHGPLNTAVHLVPHLEPKALAMSNCLLNAGAFPTIANVCYNYTLLLPQDLPRFLGCTILNPTRLAFDDIALQHLHLPRRLDQLASKKELHTWLAHLLLCIVCNATPVHPPMRIDLPANLYSYLHVLVHLHRVGFPSHWIGDFLQSVIFDSLVTDVQPYLGRTPILKSQAGNRKAQIRKVYLEAWQAEFQVMLASTIHALPFAVALPSNYPAFSDIRTFKATIKPIDLKRHPMIYQWKGLISGITKTVGLLFFKPTKSVNADMLASRIPAILEGDGEVREAKVQIMLGQESVDFIEGEITWKLSQSWYEKMKLEKWCMAAYRTDLTVTVTEPVKASQWVQLS